MAKTRQHPKPIAQDTPNPLRRTYAEFFGVSATGEVQFHPYSDVLNHAEGKRYFNYLVAANTAYVEYLDEKCPHVEARKKGAKMRGWKLHISLQTHDLEDIWSRLFEIFRNHQIDYFKVVRPDKLRDEPQIYCAKQITIYCEANKKKDWYPALKAINKLLDEKGCQPVALPQANKLIAGSQFISCRNDNNPELEGEYISDVKAEEYAATHAGVEAYNPIGDPEDPFAGIDLSEAKIKMSAC